MTSSTVTMDRDDVRRAIHRIAHEIVERHHGAADVVLVGIHTRGVPLARGIADAIAQFEDAEVPVGELDIGLYRDDIGSHRVAHLGRTLIPVDISDRPVVLVDDVLFTGRTIRAALDALSDLGRASLVQLAVLVDRGHRQLPIRADYVGKNLPTSPTQRVAVRTEEIDGESGVWLGPGENGQ